MIYFCFMEKEDLGQRLARLRKARGFTQRDFAASVGISQRMVAYYEKHVRRPSPEKLERMANALRVSSDEILGIKPTKNRPGAPKNAYLQRKLQEVYSFSKADQKTITNMIDALSLKNAKHKAEE